MREITEADVGKKYKNAIGETVLILGFLPNKKVDLYNGLDRAPILVSAPVITYYDCFTTDGHAHKTFDLVECLDDKTGCAPKPKKIKIWKSLRELNHIPKTGENLFKDPRLEIYSFIFLSETIFVESLFDIYGFFVDREDDAT